MKHSTNITGVTRYRRNGKDVYVSHIAKEKQKWQKTTYNLYDAILWRAKKERELYGLDNLQTEKLIVLINDAFSMRYVGLDKQEIEEAITGE